MTDFFRKELSGDPGMKLFGPLHLCVSAVFLIALAAIFVFRKKLRGFGQFKAVRIAMSSVLFLSMLVHYSARIIIGEWHIGEDLPFHICFVANFFMMYILFTDNKHGLYRVIYYFTLIGPLPAIIWPDLHRSMGGWVFYQFVISHHFMLLCSMYCLLILRYEIDTKGAVIAFFTGNAYVGLIAVFNRLVGTNYIMLGELPAQLYEIYPFLDKMPAFFWLELVGILMIFTAYVPTRLIKREPQTKRSAK